jgi:hypothetical protein
VIRQTILRGHRPVSGLLLVEPHAADDAIRHWQTGASLTAIADRYLVVRLAEPIERRCEVGRLTPLVDLDGRLSALELSPTQLHNTPPGSLIHLKDGTLHVERLEGAIEPSTLLDLRNWEVARPQPTEERTPEPAGRRPSEPPLATNDLDFETRQALGNHQAPKARERRRQQKLQTGRQNTPRTRANRTNRSLTDWLANRRHHKYLDDLTNLFASDRLEEALRLAIPLGEGDGPAAKRRFRPRADLTLRPRRPKAGSVVRVEPGLRNQLQNRYRQAFVRLDQQGRVLDAAFVLADLLNRVGEACSYLERHDQIQLAAELSESRSGDHAETVRLWWRAGDRQRAVAIARRHGAFAAAISRLERTQQSNQADELRRAWTAQLLQAGDVVGAYDVIAKQHDDVSTAIRNRLIDLGAREPGPLRARMLARQLRAHHEAPHPAVEAVLEDPSARPERELLAAELTTRSQPIDHPDAARALLRRLLADRPELPAKTLESLAELTDDPILYEDLPPLSARPQPAQAETLWIDTDPTDRGLLAMSDGRALPDGRIVVAIDGGIGVRVIKPNGKTEAEFDVPADELVLSDNALHLLALHRVDDGVVTVRQITLPERRVRTIGDIPANVWAQSYDGGAWYHANGAHLIMLDILAHGPSALWRQATDPESILVISRNPSQMAVASLSLEPGGIGPPTIVRRYLLPSLKELPAMRGFLSYGQTLEPSGEIVPATSTGGGYLARIESASPDGLTVVAGKQATEVPLAVVRLGAAEEARIRIDNDHLVTVDNLRRLETVNLALQRHWKYRPTP